MIVSRKGEPDNGDVAPSILGTIVELNVVRDARVGYRNGFGGDGTLFRRNHAYFWYPVSTGAEPPVAFAIDPPDATVALDGNTVEGKVGELKPKDVIELQRPEAP